MLMEDYAPGSLKLPTKFPRQSKTSTRRCPSCTLMERDHTVAMWQRHHAQPKQDAQQTVRRILGAIR